MARYEVFDGSQSAHCCFEATVIDTTKPLIIAGKPYVDSRGRAHCDNVCECMDPADAQRICDALNAQEK